jgi:hypothetical protein
MATTAQTAATLLNGSFSAETLFEAVDSDTVSFSISDSEVGRFYGLARRFGLSPSGSRNEGKLEGELDISDEFTLSTTSLETLLTSVFSADTEISSDEDEGTVTARLAEEDVGKYFRIDRTLNLTTDRHRENGSMVVTFQTP